MRGRDGMATQRSVEVQFWRSEAVRALPKEGKLLMLHFMTGPSSNLLGLVKLQWDDVVEEADLTREEVEENLARASLPQVDGEPLIQYDAKTRLVWVVKRLEHEFPDGKISLTQRKAIRRLIEIANPCPLLLDLCRRYHRFGEPFITLTETLSRKLSHTLSDRDGKKEEGKREPEAGTREPDTEIVSAGPAAPRTAEPLQPAETDPAEAKPANEEETYALDLLNSLAGTTWKAGKKYGGDLRARLRDGYTLEDLCRVIRLKVAQWKGDPHMAQYLSPTTLFRPSNFERYLEETRSVHTRSQGPPLRRDPLGRVSSVDAARLLRNQAERLRRGDGGGEQPSAAEPGLDSS